MTGTNAAAWIKVVFYLALAAIVGFLILKGWQAVKQLFTGIGNFFNRGYGTAFNPASNQNVAYRAASAPVRTFTGRDETLGGFLADWLSPQGQALRNLGFKQNANATTVAKTSYKPGWGFSLNKIQKRISNVFTAQSGTGGKSGGATGAW
jgi:hypothetical protein